jgi:hypothetical protein
MMTIMVETCSDILLKLIAFKNFIEHSVARVHIGYWWESQKKRKETTRKTKT